MNPACEDSEFISNRLKELAAEREQRCPVNSGLTLYNCLRSSSKCDEACPHRGDWMGPDRS